MFSQNPAGRFETQPVLKCYRHPSTLLWRITTIGGVVVRATGNHRFLTGSGWERVRRLAPGHTVWTVVAGRAVADVVRDVVQTSEAEPVFNIVVRRNFNFVADVVLAGSFATLMGVQARLWRVREMLECFPGNMRQLLDSLWGSMRSARRRIGGPPATPLATTPGASFLLLPRARASGLPSICAWPGMMATQHSGTPAALHELRMNVYLDDERKTPENWVRVYSPNDAIELLATGQVERISLDHDLGDDTRGTGYDVVLWIEEMVATSGFKPPQILVHSANSSAREKMLAGVRKIQALAAGR